MPHGCALVECGVSFHVKLVGAWQIQDPFGDEIEDHFAADRRNSGDIAFAQIALDMIFARIPHAAQRKNGALTGFVRRLGGKHLAGIGFGGTGFS